jgi:hypothetical protein
VQWSVGRILKSVERDSFTRLARVNSWRTCGIERASVTLKVIVEEQYVLVVVDYCFSCIAV